MYIWLFMALISIEEKSTRYWVKLLHLLIPKDPSPCSIFPQIHSAKQKMPPKQTPEALQCEVQLPKM